MDTEYRAATREKNDLSSRTGTGGQWMFRLILVAALACVIITKNVLAHEVRIAPAAASISMDETGTLTAIARGQDIKIKIANEITETSRPCPSSCSHPVTAAPGLAAMGEIKVTRARA
jgi:hypothetical protein